MTHHVGPHDRRRLSGRIQLDDEIHMAHSRTERLRRHHDGDVSVQAMYARLM